MTSSTRTHRIEAILRQEFFPSLLTVTDDSKQHAGHSGARAGGQTHYTAFVVSATFQGLTRVERHRAVNAALAEEFTTGLHALALVLRTPDESAGS